MLLDIQLGDGVGSGIDLIGPLRATDAKVVMLTVETRRGVLASCLEAGAAGWLCKDAFLDDVETALGDVLAGRPLIGRAPARHCWTSCASSGPASAAPCHRSSS